MISLLNSLVGMLLNAYGRDSMLVVRHASDQTCASCTSRDCVLPGNRKKLVGRSCPSLLNPAKLNSTSDCLVCGQCIKSCTPFNMKLFLRSPFHPADYREPLASWSLTLFIMLVSGFVTFELCTEWDQAKHVFLWIPQQLSLSKAIHYAQDRLKRRAENVCWIEADITEFESSVQYDLWHDRAVFHFLTDAEDRTRYVRRLEDSVKPGGHVVIAAFAIDGPLKCSGLEVERYNPEKMGNELGDSFDLVNSVSEAHITPWNKQQEFIYCYFRKILK